MGIVPDGTTLRFADDFAQAVSMASEQAPAVEPFSKPGQASP
jgi:hypothetical protein